MTSRIEILENADRLAQAAADRFVQAAQEALALGDAFRVALSGGSTPRRAYARLVEAELDWGKVHVFWGDERCVPPEHVLSNYRLARQSLLDHVPIPDPNVHRIPGELEPATGAQAYERELAAAFFGTHAAGPFPPRFDLILLGLGGDGHTASLFPGSSALAEQERWVLPQPPPGDGPWRLTLTPPVINAAAGVVFLVSGTAKAEVVQRVLRGPHAPHSLPAQLVQPTRGQVRWMLDASAAARL